MVHTVTSIVGYVSCLSKSAMSPFSNDGWMAKDGVRGVSVELSTQSWVLSVQFCKKTSASAMSEGITVRRRPTGASSLALLLRKDARRRCMHMLDIPPF